MARRESPRGPGLEDAYGDYESSAKNGNAYKAVKNGKGGSLNNKASLSAY